jgi:RHS repeat-associated protein
MRIDLTNNLSDHTSTKLSASGVRKYDYETGHFNSIDPLFEKYYGWSPYQYAGNNPIWAKDWNGEIIETIADVGFIAYDLWDIGVTLYNGDKVTATQIGALGADILGAAVPFATGGGMAVRALAKADEIAKLGYKTTNLLEGIVEKSGAYFAKPETINDLGKNLNFSNLDKIIHGTKDATWKGNKTGGKESILHYKDKKGNIVAVVHEVTDKTGLLLHRDFDAVRLNSGQMINKARDNKLLEALKNE